MKNKKLERKTIIQGFIDGVGSSMAKHWHFYFTIIVLLCMVVIMCNSERSARWVAETLTVVIKCR
jgi:hypothetical protein